MHDHLSSDLASLRIDRDAAPVRSGARWGRWAVALLAIGGAVAAGTVAWPSLQARIFKTEVQPTEIAVVSPAQAAIDLTSTGYVVPEVQVNVAPKVVGRIAVVHVREGQDVKAGDVLFELDPADQKSALAAAQARVATARARAQAARARAQTARARAVTARAQLAETTTQYEREKKLAESGAVAPSSANDLEMRKKSLETQVTAADADAQAADADALAADAEATAAQVEVSTFATSLGNMTIPAPIDGRAISKPNQVGDVVSPSNTLVVLADFRTLQVLTDVPEARLHLVKPAGPVEIVLDAFPDRRLRGSVVQINPLLNRAKATGVVKVKFDDDVDGVLPEMAARVSFLAKALDEKALKEAPKRVVPASAVVDRGGVKHVWVIDGDKVRLVPVTIGAPFAGGFELVDGPAPGTRVVKDPPPTLSDGAPVKERS